MPLDDLVKYIADAKVTVRWNHKDGYYVPGVVSVYGVNGHTEVKYASPEQGDTDPSTRMAALIKAIRGYAALTKEVR